jgi:hypothetical protein
MASVETNQYLFEYRHEGADWGIQIAATSPDDARKRLESLNWARYQGQVAATIPVPSTGFGKLLANLSAWWLNLLSDSR